MTRHNWKHWLNNQGFVWNIILEERCTLTQIQDRFKELLGETGLELLTWFLAALPGE